MTTLQPGQMLGPYQITGQIGKGGMAAVYKAYHASMDRYVALKVVSGQFTDDPNFMQRFRQEARLIAKLEHPHILPVHDFGEADGIPYMVMRFLEAGTLKERLDAGQLSLPEVDHIFSQLAKALEYAHENGVIHRDIKPSNAMLDRRGDVFLTDFGIARMLEGTSALTATGAITGTPAYMSPEQAQGNRADQRSDVYSLGVVLFEMLTGHVPFEAETPMAVLFRQIQDPPPPLSVVRPDLPYTLEGVLLKAMAKSPADRYASMSAFLTGWKNALTEASTVPPPVARPEPRGAATIPPTVETPSPAATKTSPEAPAKKGFNWKLLALGAGVLVCAASFCLAFPVILNLQFLNLPPTSTSPGATRTSDPNLHLSEPDASEEPPAASEGPGGATSWSAANSAYSLSIRGDEILASGFGGVTIWKPDGSYEQITTANGLPNANAGVVFAENDGSIWVGTDSGLAHIAGEQVTVYTAEDGLSSNSVVFISRVNDQLLLAGTQYSGVAGGGLAAFDGSKWESVDGFPSSPEPDDSTVNYNVRQIVMDPLGNLWVATESGIAMRDTNNQWRVFKTSSGLPENNVYSIHVSTSGDLLAGTANGSVVRFDYDQGVFESYADLKDFGIYDVYAILTDQAGTEWYAGGNVARYDPSTQEWTSFNADQGTLPVYSVRSMAIDSQGTLYFGTEQSGVARYQNGAFDILAVPNALHFGEYGRIIPAPSGELVFVQLYENGADRFNPADESWTKIPSEQYIPRAFDAQGQMWSGGWNGLWIFGADSTQVTTEHGLPSDRVTAVTFASDGTAYIATDAGIAVFDGLKVTDVYNAAEEGLLSDDIYSLFLASDGSLWASLNGGFSRRKPDGTWENFTAETLFGGYSQYFPAIVEGPPGNIWVTSLGDGLYLFSQDQWTRMHSTDPGVGLPSDYLTAAMLAPDGALWIGSDGFGAVRYDGQTWQTYNAEDGLINQNVNGIYVDPDGAVWFTTNGGVTRLEP